MKKKIFSIIIALFVTFSLISSANAQTESSQIESRNPFKPATPKVEKRVENRLEKGTSTKNTNGTSTNMGVRPLVQERKELRNEIRQEIRDGRKARLLNIQTVVEKTIIMLETAGTRLETRIVNIEKTGKDMTEARALLASSTQNIAKAKTGLSELKLAFVKINDQSTPEEINAVKKMANETMKNIKTARELMIRAITKTGVSIKAPNTSTTTSTTTQN